jgi:predicted nucleic acid-binding protein
MIAVDASVAVKWLFEEEHSDRAEALVATRVQQQEPIIAPPLLPVEVTNIIRQRRRRGDVTLDQARERLAIFFGYRVHVIAPAALYDRALTLAEEQQLPAAYDAHYLALAELEGCDLWTADQRLLRQLDGRLPFVRFIGDYDPGKLMP